MSGHEASARAEQRVPRVQVAETTNAGHRWVRKDRDAPFAGTVRGVGANLAPGRSGDRNILIGNPDGEGQYFGHLNKALVQVGQKVKAGQKIGEMGARGNVTGPHLHFETWANWRNPNSHFNPKTLFDKYKVTIGSVPVASGGGSAPTQSKPTPAPKPKE